MKFTWYTYRAALRKAEADFSHAFKDEINTGELFNENSRINRTRFVMNAIRARWERESPGVDYPPRALRELFNYITFRRYPRP